MLSGSFCHYILWVNSLCCIWTVAWFVTFWWLVVYSIFLKPKGSKVGKEMYNPYSRQLWLDVLKSFQCFIWGSISITFGFFFSLTWWTPVASLGKHVKLKMRHVAHWPWVWHARGLLLLKVGPYLSLELPTHLFSLLTSKSEDMNSILRIFF